MVLCILISFLLRLILGILGNPDTEGSEDIIIDLFLLLQKKNQKKELSFTKVFFILFYRTLKNRLKSLKFFPRLQKFFTGFSNYTLVKDPI